MPLIAQLCVCFATLALVGIAVTAIRVMLQTRTLIQNANLSPARLPAMIDDARRASARADELLLELTSISRSAGAGAAAAVCAGPQPIDAL